MHHWNIVSSNCSIHSINYQLHTVWQLPSECPARHLCYFTIIKTIECVVLLNQQGIPIYEHTRNSFFPKVPKEGWKKQDPNTMIITLKTKWGIRKNAGAIISYSNPGITRRMIINLHVLKTNNKTSPVPTAHKRESESPTVSYRVIISLHFLFLNDYLNFIR